MGGNGVLDLFSMYMDVAFFIVLLYGSCYWLGCTHGIAVLVCSVSVKVKRTELEKKYNFCMGWSMGLLLSNGL